MNIHTTYHEICYHKLNGLYEQCFIFSYILKIEVLLLYIVANIRKTFI